MLVKVNKLINKGNLLPPYANTYKNRVVSDSGIITDISVVKTIMNYLSQNSLLSLTRVLLVPEMGLKTRTDTDTFVSKLYSTDSTPNDATQTTALSQPYLAGDIAPNERYGVKSFEGQTRNMIHPNVSYSSTDKWSCTFIVNWNGTSATNENIIGTKDVESVIRLKSAGYNNISIRTLTTVDKLGFSTLQILGKNAIISITADGNGTIKIYLNGVLASTLTSLVSDFLFNQILAGRSINGSNVVIKYHRVQNNELTAAQVLSEYNMLRGIYPEVESVKIGTQVWATSNCDIVVTPMGTVIPEVTDNTAWKALTTPAWCYYNNDSANGAIYGKLYNWYAVKQIQDDITAYNLANPTTPYGWHVPTLTEFQTLSTYLGRDSISGGKLKHAGLTYWQTPNTGATNESGLTFLPNGSRNFSGIFIELNTAARIWQSVELNTTQSTIFYLQSSTRTFSSFAGNKINGCSLRLIKD